jgi:hypothetical protein
MFTDELVQEWLQRYDNLTSFSFSSFKNISEDELTLLTKGISAHLLQTNNNPLHCVVYDDIDEETAKALGTYQGSSITFIFPGKCIGFEDLVKHVVLSGFEFLRIKGDYLGATEAFDYA